MKKLIIACSFLSVIINFTIISARNLHKYGSGIFKISTCDSQPPRDPNSGTNGGVINVAMTSDKQLGYANGSHNNKVSAVKYP